MLLKTESNGLMQKNLFKHIKNIQNSFVKDIIRNLGAENKCLNYEI